MRGLRPAPTVADTLPRVRLDVAQLNVTGLGLLALWRKGVVPVDSIVLDSARIEVLALAKDATKDATQPMHERSPLKIEGLKIGYFGLLYFHVNYLNISKLHKINLAAQKLLISPAGAADSQRLAYAAAWSTARRRWPGTPSRWGACGSRRLTGGCSSTPFAFGQVVRVSPTVRG